MVIVLCSIARCVMFGVPRLPVRPCDERPPAIYGHFCLVQRVSVHDRYMIVQLMAELCRLSLVFHAYCNGSPNVRRSNSGQQVYAGHVCTN